MKNDDELNGAANAKIAGATDAKNAPEPAGTTDASAQKKSLRLWLALAAVALVAAFVAQWKNSLDMAAIAETADGRTVRVENSGAQSIFRENGELGILLADARAEDFAGALLCSDSGKILAHLEPTEIDANDATSPGAAGTKAKIRHRLRVIFTDEAARAEAERERFLRVVFPALRGDGSDGAPVVLILQT